jgi:hypothetical protein
MSIIALVATVGMNAYSAMLTLITTLDSIRPVRPTQTLRIVVIAGVTLGWISLALSFGGDAITYVNAMLVIMLYFLMPWTAVNLIDYFWLRRGRYSIRDLFTPHGLYGAWGTRGLGAYAIGFIASIPFFVSGLQLAFRCRRRVRGHRPRRSGGEHRPYVGRKRLTFEQDEIALDFVEVLAHGIGEAGRIAALDEADEMGMSSMGAAAHVGSFVNRRDQEGLRHQLPEEIDHDPIAGNLREQRVKIMRSLQLERAIGFGFALLLPLDVHLEALDGFGVGLRHDVGRQRRFDQTPRRENLLRFPHAGVGHKGAAISVQGHDLVVGERMQHGADPHAADVEHLGQLIFDESDPRQDPAFDDGRMNLGVDGRLFGLAAGGWCAPRLRSDGSNVHGRRHYNRVARVNTRR